MRQRGTAHMVAPVRETHGIRILFSECKIYATATGQRVLPVLKRGDAVINEARSRSNPECHRIRGADEAPDRNGICRPTGIRRLRPSETEMNRAQASFSSRF
jgi:hypothetical protein